MRNMLSRRRAGAALVALAAVAASTVACSSGDDGGGDADRDEAEEPALSIEVISSRPEHVTGGNARIAVTVGEGLRAEDVEFEVEGTDGGVVVDVIDDPDHPGRGLLAAVEGLPEGPSTVVATHGRDTAELELVNHPISGPLFAGEQLPLVACTTETYGLAPSTPEEGCFAETKVTWSYVDRAGVRKPLPDDAEIGVYVLPTDVDVIGLPGNQSAPFVIRTETGVINRSVYRIDTLVWGYGEPIVADLPDTPWNGRLVYRFGGGCGSTFSQGFMGTGDPSLELLRKGYATATATFNTYQVMCNDVLSAETAAMVKEHFTENYGEPDLTIGEGGSGGAIQQILLAQNYPGLLDGIAPTVPFPDAFSIAPGVFDCALLTNYYATPGGTPLSPEQRQAVNGHATAGTCGLWDSTFAQGIDPVAGCKLDLASAFPGAASAAGSGEGAAPPPAPGGIPPEDIYDAETNPDGLRCTVWETNVALTGRDPDTGFARSGYDNSGVQYGLDALNAGVITPDQFLDLNEKVGGFDQDGQPQPERSAVESDLMAMAYENGRVSGPWGGLPDTPMILVNVFTDAQGDIHDRVRSFSMLDRLADDDGNPPPTVSLWTIGAEGSSLIETLTGALGDLATGPTFALDAWLTAAQEYQADHDEATWPEALAETKPEEAESRCAVGGDVIVGPDANTDPACTEAYPISEEPRMAAGGPRAGDVLKCELLPVDDAGDLYEVELSDAELDRLADVFPDGVCDYSQPSLGAGEPEGTWLSYVEGEGD